MLLLSAGFLIFKYAVFLIIHRRNVKKKVSSTLHPNGFSCLKCSVRRHGCKSFILFFAAKLPFAIVLVICAKWGEECASRTDGTVSSRINEKHIVTGCPLSRQQGLGDGSASRSPPRSHSVIVELPTGWWFLLPSEITSRMSRPIFGAWVQA